MSPSLLVADTDCGEGRFYQRLSKFSQDFDARARRFEPTRSSLASTRLRALVKQPTPVVVWSLFVVVRPGNERSRCL